MWLAKAERQLGVKTDGEHEISEEQVSGFGINLNLVVPTLPAP